MASRKAKEEKGGDGDQVAGLKAENEALKKELAEKEPKARLTDEQKAIKKSRFGPEDVRQVYVHGNGLFTVEAKDGRQQRVEL